MGSGRYSGVSRSEEYVRIPDMQTLTELFRKQLKISPGDQNPRVKDIIDYLVKRFPEAARDPSQIGGFHTIWEKVLNAPRDEAGNLLLEENLTSEITLDKIQKW